jgi:hypothetical protein
VLLEDREDVLRERRPAGHPLIVGAPAVRIWAVEARAWEARYEPPKEGLVACMHPKGDMRLLAIATEMPLAEEDSD